MPIPLEPTSRSAAWPGRRGLTLGAATAPIDEISTYAGMVAVDRWHRPGVSVTLESEWVGPALTVPGSCPHNDRMYNAPSSCVQGRSDTSGPRAGTVAARLVRVNTWPLRVGKTLGFL